MKIKILKKKEVKAYLLLLWVEFDELLQEDDEEGYTDHADEANTHAGESAQVSLRVVVTVADGCHRHEAHPQRIEEVPEVLLIACKCVRLLTRLHDQSGDYTDNHHHEDQNFKRSCL